ITCDADNNVYITGQTQSTNNIATTGVHKSTLTGGIEAFLVKFNAAGTRQWGTYYGGNVDAYGHGLAVCPQGRIYLVGYTTNTTGIATTGAFKASYSGG